MLRGEACSELTCVEHEVSAILHSGSIRIRLKKHLQPADERAMAPHHLSAAHARRPLLLISALVTVGLLVACGTAADTDPVSTSQTQTGEVTTSGSPTTTAIIYFVDDQGLSIVADDIAIATGDELPAALTALVESDPPAGALPAVPPGTRLLSAVHESDVATIDLSQEFASGYPTGGAAAEFAAVAPLVFTATRVDGVSAVRILVDGAEPVLSGSQFDWSRSFVREDFAALSETVQ